MAQVISRQNVQARLTAASESFKMLQDWRKKKSQEIGFRVTLNDAVKFLVKFHNEHKDCKK